jgi:ADP-heptose:LPS heptosyltransferase
LRAERYDAVIDLQGLLKSAVLARAVGARRTVGFPRAHLREPLARLFYTRTADVSRPVHVVFKNLALLEAVGVREPRVEFPLEIPSTDTAEHVRRAAGASGYVLLNPGAAWPNKRWPAKRFGWLASAIRERLGLSCVVLWGPGEKSLAADVVSASGGAAAMAPETTLTDLFAIAREARLMVSGDTGPLHVAAAVGTPVVALFGPTWAERNGPWAPTDVTLTRNAQCVCHYQRRCRRDDPCIEGIALDEVVGAVDRCVRAVSRHGRETGPLRQRRPGDARHA